MSTRICFARSASECEPAGRILDLKDVGLLKNRGVEWSREFVDWMSRLNAANAGVEWWAYASTSKNLLSSALGERFLAVKAICEAARQTAGQPLCVLHATPGQISTMERLLGSEEFDFTGRAYRSRRRAGFAHRLDAALRQGYIALRTWLGHLGAGSRLPGSEQDVCAFTYADMLPRPAFDAYFGTLPQRLEEIRSGLRFFFAAYLYAPYRARLKQLARDRAAPTAALFGVLSALDHAWALAMSLRQALGGGARWSVRAGTADRPWACLLEEALLDDLRVGGYLHHLLVYRAARRFFARARVKTLLYPFENKSIEKCLILGARAVRPRMRVTGYQHTSVTPRHIGFAISEAECRATPLPDRIVTVGEVTLEWLRQQGYPSTLLVPGCSLRQSLGASLPARKPDGRLRVLLALSSSVRELRDAVRLVRTANAAHPDLHFAVRPHPNFPLALLDREDLEWIRRDARDCSGTSLRDDLEWCDVLAYASSTVVLEALAAGRPVVHLTLSEYLSTDPVLGSVGYHRVARTAGEFTTALRYFQGMPESACVAARVEARAYVSRYLRAPTAEALGAFLL